MTVTMPEIDLPADVMAFAKAEYSRLVKASGKKLYSLDDLMTDQLDAMHRGAGVTPELPEQVNTLSKFLTSGAVYTIDEVDQSIRPFPLSKYNPDGPSRWDYLRIVMEDYEGEHKVWACEKSRRMMITWILCASYLYFIMTQPNSRFFIGSRNFEKSCFILGASRIAGVYRNIPADIWPDKPKVEFHYKSPDGYQYLYCPATNSYIMAMYEDPEGLRQYTVTRAWFDEFAFWKYARKVWKGSLQTISGGGRIDLSSTANFGSFMYQLLYRDDPEVTVTGDTKTHDQKLLQLMRDQGILGGKTYEGYELAEGIEARDTISTGIHILKLHYSADPVKADPVWIAEERMRFSSQDDWDSEMEINWLAAGSGVKVFNGFRESFHVSKERLRVSPEFGGSWFRGWDFANQPCCVICRRAPSGQMQVLDAIVTWDGVEHVKTSNIAELAPKVVAYCNLRWPGVDWVDFIDPSGNTRAQTDSKTCREFMLLAGITNIQDGPVTFQARTQAIIELLSKNIGGEPALIIDRNCDMIKQGFKGAYRWKEEGRNTGRLGKNILQNAWAHPMSALQYAMGGVTLPHSMLIDQINDIAGRYGPKGADQEWY